jgi:hypothetical protein
MVSGAFSERKMMAGTGSDKFEIFEGTLFLMGAAAFLLISVWSLVSLLFDAQVKMPPRIGLAALSFTFALICFTVSPANQGRTLRKLLERLPPEKSTVNDLANLQRSVGAAGFFNRIGLTGIPLTVALFALVFCGLTFLARRLDYESGATAFLDLTKLTVGAFIGSLTTKNRDRPEDRPNQ